ncbi:MFS transporter [Saccharopolyspora sp. K220]|uniref:MFS transporter n=1 Tax=Saccharopolyspora soli TaxID=2926618 RepID=UPI001F5979BC|nr:MFS transporter [Saccharopolyspora soli]MCI2417806.1 MFS transporter [Saccharopolyspora soli]
MSDSTTSRPVIDVVPLIENQKIGRFWTALFAVAWLVTFLEGFDLQIISFAGSYLKRDLALSNTQLGTLGTVGVVGQLFGGIAIAYLGDRFGRKPAIVGSVAGFGVFMVLFAFAADYPQLVVLRFATGFFIGGALPLVWALVTEFAPTRLRSTSVVIVMVGYSLGSASGGPVSNLLIPDFGWASVFLAGGIASLAMLVPVLLFLPESVKFLAQRGLAQHRIIPVLRRVSPGIQLPSDARFVVGTQDVDRTRFTPASLFRGGRLALITPLVWGAWFCSATVVFYLAFWGPILNEQIGFSVSAAATLASGTSVAGALGQVLISRFIDRRGAGAIMWMPLLAVPCLLLIGFAPLGAVGYVLVLVVAHILIVGGNGGVISISGIFYRPAIRASGGGWAASVSKLGAMLGPWLAGLLLDNGIDAKGTFYVFAIFPVAMVVLLAVLGRIQRGLPADADGSLRPASGPQPRDPTEERSGLS